MGKNVKYIEEVQSSIFGSSFKKFDCMEEDKKIHRISSRSKEGFCVVLLLFLTWG